MNTWFFEAENVRGDTHFNWGKFMVARFDEEEWARASEVDGVSLIAGRGWAPWHLLVFDLQTGEGALFSPGGFASADLEKHKVWVCPLFEPFLKWLYKQDLSDLAALPKKVTLSFEEAPPSFTGYRRPGA